MQTPATQGRVFNIGSDQPVSILELAQRVLALAQSSSQIEFQTYSQAYDADFEDIRHRVPDLTRLRAAIGNRSTCDLDVIIRDVIAWKKSTLASGSC
jgi:UDP-glucose 4-epimerase